jgi:hypothetical protein
MNNTTHTPAPTPWVIRDNAPWFSVADDNRHTVACRIASEANAHLIAAAPDLLAALETLLPVAATAFGALTVDLDAARAAIAKAKGQ